MSAGLTKATEKRLRFSRTAIPALGGQFPTKIFEALAPTRHPGYAASQPHWGILGWTVAGLRRTKLRDLAKVDWVFTFAAAYDLAWVPKLIGAAT
jgi:hypothetical protein